MSRRKSHNPLGWLRDKTSGLFGRSPLVFARRSSVEEVTGIVRAVLRNEETGDVRVHTTKNLVTNDGDRYYAERAALLTTGTPIAPVPANFTDANGVFDGVMELYESTLDNIDAPAKGNDRSNLTSGDGALASTEKAITATYPLTNDGDANNPGPVGVDIVTYKYEWTAGDFNSTDITDGIITNPSPGASEDCLTHFSFTKFTKTSSDTLTVYVNHTFNGT